MDRRALIPPTSQGPIDVSLWDIAGKALGLPVYNLLGGYRDKVKAYASSPRLPSPKDYADHAEECKKRGCSAYKLHVWGEPKRDLAACREVRKAVGDDVKLMLDASARYDHREALIVGRKIEELGFYWYEEPLRDYDMHGYIELCRSLDIPVAAAEWLPGSIYSSPQYIVNHAFDIIRSDVQIKGGITALKKTASLCESFGMKCEFN